jgi:hypothetical protein
MPNTNLRVIQPSRRKPNAGDVFALWLPDDTYVFGRVIEADISEPNRAPMPGSYLVYVYQHRAREMSPDLEALTTDALLIPPLFTNRMPWTKGYFSNVAHEAPRPEHELAELSFWDALRGEFVDRERNTLDHEIPPAGTWGLVSYRWLDDRVSEALGFEPVPRED